LINHTWGWIALFALRPRCETTVVVRSKITTSNNFAWYHNGDRAPKNGGLSPDKSGLKFLLLT